MTTKTTRHDNSYQTPEAIQHDAHLLADDVRSLLQSTADVADEKVMEVRRRLESALSNGRELFSRAQDRATQGATRADQCIRDNPYPSMAIAFGIGTFLGILLRRSS